MVDILSAASGARTIRRVSSFRLRRSLSSDSEAQAAAAVPESGGDHLVRVCLEIHQDKTSGETLYRLIDLATGTVIREWSSGELGDLRDFLQQNRIQFLDETV